MKVSEEVGPGDSISATSRSSHKSKASNVRSVTSTVSSARLKAELEKAALLAKAASLKQRQALNEQELKFKAEREQMEVQTALDTADAHLKVL